MTQSVIGALRVNLGLDSARFRSGAREAQGIADRLGRHMQRIGTAMSAVGAGLALAIRGQISAADDLQKAADRVGVPVEAFSQLAHAASLGGASLEHLETGLRGLSERMVRQPDLFNAMGIAIRDAEGNMRPTVDVLADVADRLQAMPEGAARTEAAMRLMGEAGIRLIPTLQGGAAGLRGMMAEADSLGLTLDERTGRAAEQFNDNLSRLSAVMGGLVRQIAAALLPIMVQITDAMQSFARGFAQLSPTMQTWAAGLSALVVAGGPVLLMLGTLIRSLGALRLALAVAMGPWGALAALVAAAAGYFLTFRDNSAQVSGTLDQVRSAQDQLNTALGTFYTTGAPSAGAEAVAYARNLEQTALAAIAASEAVLSFNEARLEGISPEALAAMQAQPGWESNPMRGILEQSAQAREQIEQSRIALNNARETIRALSIEMHTGTSAATGGVNGLGQAVQDLNISLNTTADVSGGAAQAVEEIATATESAKDRLQNAAGTLTELFMAATQGADAARSALARLLSRLAEALANRAFMSLLGGMGFSGGGFLGSLLGGVSGATTKVASAASVAGAATASSAQAVSVHVSFGVDPDTGTIKPFVDNQLRRARPSIIGDAVAATRESAQIMRIP